MTTLYAAGEGDNAGHHASGAAGPNMVIGGLNEQLDINYLDVPPEDTSICAKVTRFVAGTVGKCVKPRQILVVLRLLKAVTFCFLILTVCADLMYIVFVEFVSRDAIASEKLGGIRDTIIRVYGVGLAVLAIFIELDVTDAVKNFSGLKSFIPRSLLIFFVATITNAHPLQRAESEEQGDDDLYADDDAYEAYTIETPMPNSAVVFQMVTSWVLAICALIYFVLGLLCFDRFTSRAFLSQRDPVASTAIPQNDSVPGAMNTSYNPPGNSQK